MNFNSEKMYHIGLHPEQGAGYVLLTGDPGRVESIARRRDSPSRWLATENTPLGRGRWPAVGCW